MKWAKSLMMNSCDVVLVKRIDKKVNEFNLYEQGGIIHLEIKLDEMFTISNTVLPRIL
jgi:hypothetical protein